MLWSHSFADFLSISRSVSDVLTLIHRINSVCWTAAIPHSSQSKNFGNRSRNVGRVEQVVRQNSLAWTNRPATLTGFRSTTRRLAEHTRTKIDHQYRGWLHSFFAVHILDHDGQVFRKSPNLGGVLSDVGPKPHRARQYGRTSQLQLAGLQNDHLIHGLPLPATTLANKTPQRIGLFRNFGGSYRISS